MRSTKRCGVFAFGHVWEIVAVVVRVPFAARRWACPCCSACIAPNGSASARALDVVVDAAYCNATLTRGLSARVTVIGALRPDVVLTARPTAAARPRPGRRRTRGPLLPKPAQVVDDPRWAWTTCQLALYRRPTRVTYKTLTAQWYRGAGPRLGRMVVVRVDEGALRLRTFFCTDAGSGILDEEAHLRSHESEGLHAA